MSSTSPNLDALRIDRSRAPKSSSGGRWVLAIIIILVLGAVGAWWFTRPEVITVETMLVVADRSGSQKTTLLNATGYVTARTEATVSSKVTGKVIEVLIEEGMAVEEGQVLARLDASNVEAGLRLAEAQLESVRLSILENEPNLVYAGLELERLSALAAHRAASRSDFDRADAEFKSVEARLARQRADLTVAERELDQWKLQVDDTIIRAPFAGIVISKDSQPGEMISPISAGGGFTRTGICTIVDMDSLEIDVDVNESYINRVQSGQPVEATLDSYPDWRIPCEVIAIIPTADRQKATVKVRVGFHETDSRILPDMGVKVAFQSSDTDTTAAEKSTIKVPTTSIHEVNGRQVVWVINDNEVERRAITVGSEQGSEAIIAAGLVSGERIVINSSETLTEGTRVKVSNHEH